jgi:hypothetical protein
MHHLPFSATAFNAIITQAVGVVNHGKRLWLQVHRLG